MRVDLNEAEESKILVIRSRPVHPVRKLTTLVEGDKGLAGDPGGPPWRETMGPQGTLVGPRGGRQEWALVEGD